MAETGHTAGEYISHHLQNLTVCKKDGAWVWNECHGNFWAINVDSMFFAILLGIPGKPSAVATTFDGFPMARKGEPGLMVTSIVLVALGIGAGHPIGPRIGPRLTSSPLQVAEWDHAERV